MTTNRLNDDTRVMNTNDSEATRVAENPAKTSGAPKKVNAAAPVSKKAIGKSQWAGRLGFAGAGAAVGFAGGLAMSANAGGTSASHSGLAHAADPDSSEEVTDTNKIDDPYDYRNSNITNVEAEDNESAATASKVTGDAEHIHVTAVEDAEPEHVASAKTVVEDHSVAAAHTAEAEAPVTPEAYAGHDAPADDAPAEEVNVEVSVDEAGTIPQASEIILENENGIRYAQVDDDMSFGEAFATAREQVGAPGVFTWHGNTYGTYYAEEWNSMSADERGEFLAAVDYPEDLNREANVMEEVPAEPEPDIQLIEIEQTLTGAGELTTSAHITVDGTDVYMSDLDGDNVMDVALVDVDGDGEFTPGVDAVLPVGDANITTQDFVDMVESGNEMDVTTDMADVDFDADAMADF